MIDENLIYLGGFVLIIFVVLLVILIMMTSGKSSTKKSKRYKSSSEDFYVPLPTTYSLQLPVPIEKMTSRMLVDISKKIFTSYKAFDFKHADNSRFSDKEWHSWQISILLMTYKRSQELVIYNQEDVFNDFLLNSTDNDIKSLTRSIIKKYENYVDIRQSKDDLCKEYLWTNKDVSILFYFLANYKNYA